MNEIIHQELSKIILELPLTSINEYAIIYVLINQESNLKMNDYVKSSRKRDVIKVNLDEGETQVIEVNGEKRIVISKDCNGNTTIKTQHKEFFWVDDCNK